MLRRNIQMEFGESRMTFSEMMECCSTTVGLEGERQSRFALPSMPQVVPTQLTRAQMALVRSTCPDILDDISEERKKDGKSSELFAIIEKRKRLSGDAPCSRYGSALVIQLPRDFGPYLGKLVTHVPSLCNFASLDLLEPELVVEWQAEFSDKRKFSISVPAHAMLSLLNTGDGDYKRPAFVPTVFVADGIFSCGGFWFDELDEQQAKDSGLLGDEDYRPHQIYSEEELALAAEDARRAGSLTPWKLGPWTDAGITHLYLDVHEVVVRKESSDCSGEEALAC